MSKPKVSATTADGTTYEIGVHDLRVLIIEDSPGEWYAQGLELDYIAQGDSLAAVQDSFVKGLQKTIAEHLKLHGDVELLLKPAGVEAWREFHTHRSVRGFELKLLARIALERPAASSTPRLRHLPFDRIAFLGNDSHVAA